MPIPPTEGNFKGGGKAVRTLVIEGYTTHMGYIDLNDRMQTATALGRKPGNGQKFVHLLNLTILNSYILYKYCGENMTHLKFRKHLVKDLIVLPHEENTEIFGVPGSQSSISEI
jgi:hypothetical protein